MVYFYKQPKYFEDFKCIGGCCPESCCDGWEVQWRKVELDKLRETDASSDLKGFIDTAFEETDEEDLYKVSMVSDEVLGEQGEVLNVIKRCPFHNKETGLCDIQKELGEEYLGVVCKSYPRRYFTCNNVILRTCTTSCPAVLNLLFSDDRAVTPLLTPARDVAEASKTVSIKMDGDETFNTYPILKYRFELLDFFWDLMCINNRTVETSIILGALAAKKFSDAAASRKYNSIPELIKELRSQMNSTAVLRSVEEIVPNYSIKFKITNNAIVMFFGERTHNIDISALHNGKELIVENYLAGIENFNKAFEGKNYILRNVFINLLLDCKMPLYDPRQSIFDNYSYFVMCAAIIKTVAAAIGFTSSRIEADFRRAVSEISRTISHNMGANKDIIKEMQNIGLTTPAHLALIIK